MGATYTSEDVSILVVDDDDVDFMVIKRALKKSGRAHPLIRARDGVEGLELLRTTGTIDRPYVIFLDINMPRLNGLEMLAEMRADPALSSAVVFMLTTSAAETDKAAAHKLHAAGYILKEKVQNAFQDVLNMLDSYCRIVEMPSRTLC